MKDALMELIKQMYINEYTDQDKDESELVIGFRTQLFELIQRELGTYRLKGDYYDNPNIGLECTHPSLHLYKFLGRNVWIYNLDKSSFQF